MNEDFLILNLSVEVWNYYPVSFEEIALAVSVFLKEEKKSKGKNDEKSQGDRHQDMVAG